MLTCTLHRYEEQHKDLLRIMHDWKAEYVGKAQGGGRLAWSAAARVSLPFATVRQLVQAEQRPAAH